MGFGRKTANEYRASVLEQGKYCKTDHSQHRHAREFYYIPSTSGGSTNFQKFGEQMTNKYK